MYESYKTAFCDALDQHDQEILIPYKDQINRGFEVPLTVTHEETDYPFRMIILYDHGLFARKRRTRKNRIAKTRSTFDELSTKLNRYRLKTEEAIDKACAEILKKYHTTEFFEYRVTNDPVVTYKNAKRGRTPKGKEPEKVAVVTDLFSVELVFNESVFGNRTL